MTAKAPHDDAGLRPPAPGPTEEATGTNGGVHSENPYEDLPDTSRHLLLSMPPSRQHDQDEMVRRDSSPVPSHLRKTQQLLDFAKYVIAMVIGLAALGWMGHEYIAQFATRDEIVERQEANDAAHTHLQDTAAANGDSIDDLGDSVDELRIYSVRAQLEQQNVNDRLEQLLAFHQAQGATRAQRQVVERRIDDLDQQIAARSRTLRDPRALQRLAESVPSACCERAGDIP